MSVVNDERDLYLRNPFFTKHEPGDFTPFYTAIGICTVIGAALILLNVFFCCCSRHRDYWTDSNTGNRWVLPIWSKTPHLQPPLDYTELDKSWLPTVEYVEEPVLYEAHERLPTVYLELQKRESDIWNHFYFFLTISVHFLKFEQTKWFSTYFILHWLSWRSAWQCWSW